MQPGEHVDAIRQIVAYLDDLDWADARLIAIEFGAGDPNDGVGDRRNFFLDVLREATDPSLQGMLRYVRDEADGIIPSGAAPWIAGNYRLFISHTSTHREWIGRLKTSLANFGIDGFVAHVDIEPTAEWMQTIEVALASCDALVALPTPDFHESIWTDQEVGYAMAQHVLVIPITSGAMPYGFMSRYQAITDATDAEPETLSYG